MGTAICNLHPDGKVIYLSRELCKDIATRIRKFQFNEIHKVLVIDPENSILPEGIEFWIKKEELFANGWKLKDRYLLSEEGDQLLHFAVPGCLQCFKEMVDFG